MSGEAPNGTGGEVPGREGWGRGAWRGRHGGWRRTPYAAPPWWPAEEPWPPASGHPWPRMRRRFLVRFALLAGLLFLLAIVAPIVLVWHLLTALGLSAPIAGIVAFSAASMLVLAMGWTALGARRFALPFGDLIDAAGRVEAGDYSTRVAERIGGPRELRALAHAFNAMAARLEIDEQQRRSLLADVSHELRTPLAVLQGELEAMLDGVHPIDEAHLAAILEESRMLTRLVEDLRTMALAEAGTLALHREPTDLGVLLEEVASSFGGLARSAGASIEVELTDDLPLLDVDPIRIREVLGNLVSNALRYAPAGSVVGIRAEPTAGGVAVAVSDQGPGIDPEVLPRLFERFARSSDSGGSGLGLAIARQLVAAHGGRIAAAPGPGGGTRISFELPL